MFAKATASSQNEPRAAEIVRPKMGPANDNQTRLEGVRRSPVELWPLGMLIIGLLASAVWSGGLLYGAYKLLLWEFGD